MGRRGERWGGVEGDEQGQRMMGRGRVLWGGVKGDGEA